MCLTSDAVYRIRDADAIFRIERKDGQTIAKNAKLCYTKYGSFTSNHCESVRCLVSKYILFLRMFQTFYRRFYQNTTNHVMGSRADHDKSRYEAYSVKTFVKMLSIRVADYLVSTHVGLLIRGYRFRLYIVSTKCFVLEWLSCFRISILKSPHKNIVLLVCTFPKMHSISSQNVSVFDAALR